MSVPGQLFEAGVTEQRPIAESDNLDTRFLRQLIRLHGAAKSRSNAGSRSSLRREESVALGPGPCTELIFAGA